MANFTPLLVTSLATLSLSAGAEEVFFEKDVRPILKAHCFHCHGEAGETKADLDVRLAKWISKGGETGPALIAGSPEKSLLLKMVKNGEMPKGKAHLSLAEIATLERWIAQGARTARPEPDQLGPEHLFTDEERAWWSLQPIKKPTVPLAPVAQRAQVRSEIDAFVLAKLGKAGLDFSPLAKPETLIRRLAINLTGLPPTPEEVKAFAQEEARDADGAVRRLIDRLLDSPAYGERWGRHWLDVVGYADSDGFSEKDMERKWAWKYRDYVIRSHNSNKPWNVFLQEQLAGDEMVKPPHQDLSPQDQDRIAATGFLRMGPDGTAVTNDVATRNACVADTVKIVGTAVYGLTVGCAQCHDHRYDPISHADYYRLRAVFEPGFDTPNWRVPNNRLVSLLTTAERAKASAIEVEAKKKDAERLKKQEEFITEVLEKELLKAVEKDRDSLRNAYRTAAAKRTPDQLKLLKAYPRVNQLSSGSLYLYDTTNKTSHAKTLQAMADAAAAVRATKPKEEFLHAFVEPAKNNPATIPATFIFHRGEPDQPKEKVGPGDLSVLAGWRKVALPEKLPELPTTGRRLKLAQELTDGKHPLVARVIVNRVWAHHFGKGIVASLGDFGKLGTQPTHPDLLDWLATDFVDHGWDLKRLHRQILNSTVYRQSSARDTKREQIDPDNALYSRMNVRRIEAEVLRDAMLSVAGRLVHTQGGAPVPVMHNVEGQVVLGIDTTDTAGRPSGKFVSMKGEDLRRSVYVQNRRTRPLEMFAAFDAPSMMEANCDTRPVTTVSPQSLLLMNNGYMREYAGNFAQRVEREVPADTAAQVRRMIEAAYSRTASDAEVSGAVEFVKEQTAYYEKHPSPLEVAVGPISKTPAAPATMALAALAHALLSGNEFLYVD